MKSIWKYPLETWTSTIKMPIGAKILACQLQGEHPTLWALVDIEAPKHRRMFIRIVGTGHNLAGSFIDRASYIATVQQHSLVWHIFEVPMQERPDSQEGEEK